jgi:hypothetical protein
MRHKNVGLPPNTLFSKEADIEDYLPYPPLQPLGKLLKEWPPDEVRGAAPEKNIRLPVLPPRSVEK